MSQPIRILFVDDEERVVNLLRMMFRGTYEVHTATSGQQALQLVAEHRFDVIVSDIGMPGRDGYEFVRALRALPASRGAVLPVLALTAYAREEDRQRALDAGFDDHLSKPVETETLVAAVAALLAKRSAGARRARRPRENRKHPR